LIGLGIISQLSGVVSGQDKFSNPIIARGADPSVVFVQGSYYSVQSGCPHNGSNPVICIRKSSSLQRLGSVTPVPVWTAPNSGPNAHDVWAPEIAYLDGRWYIYYAADPDENPHHSLFALVPRDPANPLGQWKEADTGGKNGGIPLDWKSAWAIDPSVFKASDGRYYLVFACRQDNTNEREGNYQSICISAMSDPLHLEMNPVNGKKVVELSFPFRSWEIRGFPTEEGPYGFTRNGVDYILYSASFSGTPDQYAEGILVNQDPPQPGGRGNPLVNPASWVKEGPVFDGHHASYGTASGVMVPSPDGSELWHVYHGTDCFAHCVLINNKTWIDRSIRVQQAGWTSTGDLVLGYPTDIQNTDGAGRSVALPIPSSDGSGSLLVRPWGAAFGDTAEGDPAAGAASGNWTWNGPSSITNASVDPGWDRIFFSSNPNFQDYVVFTKLSLLEAGPDGTPARFGVYAAYVDHRNYFLATIDTQCGNGPCLETEGAAAGRPLGRQTCPLSTDFQPSDSNTLAIEVVNGIFRILVNEHPLSGPCQQRKVALGEGQAPENGTNGQVGVAAQSAKAQFASFLVSPGVPVDSDKSSTLFAFRNAESLLDLTVACGDCKGKSRTTAQVVESPAMAPYPLTVWPGQLWKLKQEPDGFSIANVLTGMCLDSAHSDAVQAGNAKVGPVQAHCGRETSQHWQLTPAGTRSGFVIRNKETNFVLDGSDSTLSLAPRSGSASQSWQLIMP
jgi:GH43 family beta-xylosidase